MTNGINNRRCFNEATQLICQLNTREQELQQACAEFVLQLIEMNKAIKRRNAQEIDGARQNNRKTVLLYPDYDDEVYAAKIVGSEAVQDLDERIKKREALLIKLIQFKKYATLYLPKAKKRELKKEIVSIEEQIEVQINFIQKWTDIKNKVEKEEMSLLAQQKKEYKQQQKRITTIRTAKTISWFCLEFFETIGAIKSTVSIINHLSPNLLSPKRTIIPAYILTIGTMLWRYPDICKRIYRAAYGIFDQYEVRFKRLFA